MQKISLASSSGLWEGQEGAADEVVEALVEDYGLSMLTKMDDEQVQKLAAAKEKLRKAKGAGVGQKADLKALAAKKAKVPAKPIGDATAAEADGSVAEAEEAFECPIEGLAELMTDLSITEHLAEATGWCVEVGLDSLAELREVEMEADLISFLEAGDVHLKPAKATLMLKRIREM